MAIPPWLIPLAIGVVWTAVTGYFLWTGYVSSKQTVTVAFVGNSFQFVNDLPRVMEYFGNGKLMQDSTLHGSLNFYTLTRKGNGMYHRWQNSTAAINEDGFVDYGACTVPQLLLGYDEWLEDYEENYYDDGKNPCFQEPDYLEYATRIRASPEYLYKLYGENSTSSTLTQRERPPPWDYVVLNDHSMRPNDWNFKRQQSAYSLANTYAPMLEKIDAIPILYMTWGYWRNDFEQMYALVDIPTFTTKLYEGYQYYAEVLSKALPDGQEPRIAPVGLAFLVIWEENPAFWEKLFGIDNFHPSPHGTYLIACVIYCTIHGHSPPSWTRFTEPVFERARRMELTGDPLPLPTEEEAIYLQSIASRVAIHGYLPKSLMLQSKDAAD